MGCSRGLPGISGCFDNALDGCLGSQKICKIANMVILNQSPYDLPREELNQLKVESLYLQGLALSEAKAEYYRCRGKRHP